MEICDGGKTNWMGDYFALIGDRLLYSENGDTRCKLAFHLISNGNHKDGSRMLCSYVETVVDDATKSWLSDDATEDDKIRASLFPAVAPLYYELGQSLIKTSTHSELQWSLLDISRESEIESIRDIRECAFHNLEKARVIISGIVLDGVTFMEEFGFTNHHHTDEQLHTMKQDLAKIHQQLGLIQALDGYLSPALEDYYKALSISIDACGGEFHEVVAQSHNCLARVYECFAEDAMSSKEFMRDRRVAKLGDDGGELGEDIPLKHYIKSAEHYLACGLSYAGHLAKICQSNHENVLSAKNLDVICESISLLKNPTLEKDKQLFERLKLALFGVKEKLDETERRIESIKSK